MSDPHRIELVERDGVIRCEMSGWDGFVDPICPVCNEPIRWVLDMASFSTLEHGVYTLMHARCAWIPEAFDREKREARRVEITTFSESEPRYIER